jgi:uncharacterized protein YjbI with pentapeptide repeats
MKGTRSGCLFLLPGTGWDDVPKQCSTRSGAAKCKLPRKGAAARKRQDLEENVAVDGNLSQEEDVTQHTELARALVLAAWPGIISGLIEKAQGGGYQQAKLLLDLCELTGTDGSQLNEQRKQQLCDALLEGLRLQAAQVDEAAEMNANQKPESRETL